MTRPFCLSAKVILRRGQQRRGSILVNRMCNRAMTAVASVKDCFVPIAVRVARIAAAGLNGRSLEAAVRRAGQYVGPPPRALLAVLRPRLRR